MHQRHESTFRQTISRRGLLAGTMALAAMSYGRGVATGRAATRSGDIDFPARIGTLLAAAPARELADATLIPFYYADLAGQLASVGVPQPDPSDRSTELPKGFFEGTIALPLAARAFETGLSPEWFPTFGFNPYAVHQAMFMATPPNTVSIFAGGFDRETVETALENSGYATVLQETGGPYYTFGDDLSPETPVGRLGLGAMNQAMVTDDLLVFARQETDLQAVTHVVVGDEPSMSDQGPWSDMVALFSVDIVGMIPLAADALHPASPQATPAATPVTSGTASGGIEYLAFGVRVGSRSESLSLGGEGTPAATPAEHVAGEAAHVEARLRYGSADLAEREAEAIPDRWKAGTSAFTGQPLDELMELVEAKVSEQDDRVVAIDFVTEAPNRWSQMIHTQDLAPLALPVG